MRSQQSPFPGVTQSNQNMPGTNEIPNFVQKESLSGIVLDSVWEWTAVGVLTRTNVPSVTGLISLQIVLFVAKPQQLTPHSKPRHTTTNHSKPPQTPINNPKSIHAQDNLPTPVRADRFYRGMIL